MYTPTISTYNVHVYSVHITTYASISQCAHTCHLYAHPNTTLCNICAYVCTHTQVYVYLYMHIHTKVITLKKIYIHTQVYVYMNIYTYTHKMLP